jgi:soluble lytic murein transglycosylase-like protein
MFCLMRWQVIGMCGVLWAQSASQPPISTGQLQRESVAKQKNSVRLQAEGAGARLIPWELAPQPFCDPLDPSRIDPIIEATAKEQGLDPALIRAIIEQGSGFRPCAVSGRGALGLMQLMVDPAGPLPVEDPFDPKQNIEAGAKRLKESIGRYPGNLKQALEAYYGAAAVADPAGGKESESQETHTDVQAVLDRLKTKHSVPPKVAAQKRP